jgi:hypothetical protein
MINIHEYEHMLQQGQNLILSFISCFQKQSIEKEFMIIDMT